MIPKKALITAFVGLVFVVGGTATVLESFGTISGTADVRPALDFVEVQATNNSGEYVLLENQADVKVNVSELNISDSDGSDSLVSTNSTEFVSPGDYVLIVVENADIVSYEGSKEFIKASTQDGGITGGLNDGGETLDLRLQGSSINSFQYDGGCDSNKAENLSNECVDPTFVVNSTE